MIILFSTESCPRCAVLRAKLQKKNIPFEETHNLEEIIALGFRQAPILKINEDTYFDLKQANDYINSL